MSVESYIKENVSELGGKVFIAPDIPEKKLNNAISAIATEVDPDYVLAIIDTSLFGNAKEGCVFLGDAVYLRGMMEKPKAFRYESIVNAEYVCTESLKNNGKIDKKEEVVLRFDNEETESLASSLNGINSEKFALLINGIIAQSGEEKEFVTTSQTLPLAMMNEDIKAAYVKLVCNFSYSDDNIVDSKEYAEITSLIARIELETKKRIELRHYMCDIHLIEETDDLLQYLQENVPEGSFDIVKKSLIKDILYIFRLNNNSTLWKENSFILGLQRKLHIDDNQISLILSAIQSDEDILKQRKNDSEIKKAMKELASKASAVGVPMAAIYFSGSVMGLGATGITSGLAALGMGGVLGFSGMVTGIGAALLIGVGTYKGIKKVTGISELENNKQREFMLQAIIRNSQKGLNYLIEDVNEISQQLMAEIKKGEETSLKIEKMSGLLVMLSKGAQATTEKINLAEIETIMSQLPQKLDKTRLQELTNQATKEKLRTFVLSCYKETEEIQEDGIVHNHLILDDQLPLPTLEKLYEVFDSIGYTKVKDAALASAKGAVKNLVKNFTDKN